MVDKIIEAHSIQVWKMSHDADEFNRFRDLLNGSLKNGISLGKLQSSQLKNFNATLNGKSYVVVVHDGSDIRKPNAEKMENIGWVKSLTGDLVRGYSTLNSIAVFIERW